VLSKGHEPNNLLLGCCRPGSQHSAEEAATDSGGRGGTQRLVRLLTGRPTAGRDEAAPEGAEARDETRPFGLLIHHLDAAPASVRGFGGGDLGTIWRSSFRVRRDGDLEGIFDLARKEAIWIEARGFAAHWWRKKRRRGARCTGSGSAGASARIGCKRATVPRILRCSRATYQAPAPFSFLYSLPST
jgi:hypothetical protein